MKTLQPARWFSNNELFWIESGWTRVQRIEDHIQQAKSYERSLSDSLSPQFQHININSACRMMFETMDVLFLKFQIQGVNAYYWSLECPDGWAWQSIQHAWVLLGRNIRLKWSKQTILKYTAIVVIFSRSYWKTNSNI